MLKLEVSISLVLGLVLVNAKHLLPAVNAENESWKASFDVTYTPDAKLSDATSWLAWDGILDKTNSNETLVGGSISGEGRIKTPSQTSGLTTATSSQGDPQSLADRMDSIQVAPTQKMWEGESWSDGIAIDDPNEIAYSQSDTSIAGLLDSLTQDGAQPNLFPSLLPMLQAQSVETAIASPSAALNALSAPTAVQPQSDRVKMTVLPVAVVLDSKSNTAPATLATTPLLSGDALQSVRSIGGTNVKPKDSFSLSGSLLAVSAGVIAVSIWGSSVKRGTTQSTQSFHFHHRH